MPQLEDPRRIINQKYKPSQSLSSKKWAQLVENLLKKTSYFAVLTEKTPSLEQDNTALSVIVNRYKNNVQLAQQCSVQ